MRFAQICFKFIFTLQELAIKEYNWYRPSDKVEKIVGAIEFIWIVGGCVPFYWLARIKTINLSGIAMIWCIGVVLFLLGDAIVNLAVTLTSLRRFFKDGFIISLIMGFIAVMLFSPQNPVGILSLFIGFGISWILFSLLANTSVAVAANAIIAGILAMIIALLNAAFIFVPQSFPTWVPADAIRQIKGNGYTVHEAMQLLANLITVPLLLINGAALLACEIKKYWLHKYHDGKEISWTQLKK